ncbi:hypothetical protein PENTCL1PPCAC_29158, partial [Pristionchus entomophagus]
TSMTRDSKQKLKDEINRLEEIVENLSVAHGAAPYKRKGRRRKKRGEKAAEEFDLSLSSSSSNTLSEEERLTRLMEELSVDVQSSTPDLPLITAKMDRCSELWNEVMVEEMRDMLLQSTGTEVDTLDPDKLTGNYVISAMDKALAAEMSLARYLKKPEQPKILSRNAWMDNVKLSKKFADTFAHLITAMRSGDLENFDVATTAFVLQSVDNWEEKWRNAQPWFKESVYQMVAYEIIRRLDELDYFFCVFCNVVEFNVKQCLAHFASGTHCKHAKTIIESDGTIQMYGFAAKHILNLTTICDELHGFFSRQYTTPILASGAQVPLPDDHTIPTPAFLDEIKNKYGDKINGEVDDDRMKDPVYVASILPEIIKRHKGEVGKKLFNEFNKYFEKGTSIYCHRCRWTVSNRTSFYRHLQNPYHITMDYLDDGRQINLLTISVNIHMRDQA